MFEEEFDSESSKEREQTRLIAVANAKAPPVPVNPETFEEPLWYAPHLVLYVSGATALAYVFFNFNILGYLFCAIPSERMNEYGILCGVLALLVGTEINVVMLYLTISHEKFSKVFAETDSLALLFRNFITAILVGISSLICCIFGVMLDRHDARNYLIECLAFVSLAMAFAHLFKTLAVLQNTGEDVLKLMSKPENHSGGRN